MFRPVPNHVSFPQTELEILELWRKNRTYEKSLSQRKDAPRFVFYEGPPTANGLPHPGHCLTRAIKDLFPRYRTMRGYFCERKAGWDTHGLPVEVEVCKELGIHSKDEIEAYGVEPFIHRCLESVFRYTQQWERLTERLGFWIRMDEAYVTYHQSYIESVWWALKNLFDRGLLYRGNKIVWWWAQGGTALSAGEVGQGYRQVADPSVYVRFPLVGEEADLLVWTTTPWTLPSNQFAAVHPDLEYSLVEFEGEERPLWIASALVETIGSKVQKSVKVVGTRLGRELIGKRYLPPFDYYHKSLGHSLGRLKSGKTEALYWRVVAADFVTVDSGTGIVHQAPAFGEVDYALLISEQQRFEPDEGPDLLCAVGPDGKFTAEAPDYQGRWVKEADKDISRELQSPRTPLPSRTIPARLSLLLASRRGSADPVSAQKLVHSHHAISRRDDRQQPKDQLAARAYSRWPLREFSRIERRLGTLARALLGNAAADLGLRADRARGSGRQLRRVTGKARRCGNRGLGRGQARESRTLGPSADPQAVHRRRHLRLAASAGARMRRVGEVIDCWFDSGAMPFAQWGYPHQGREQFAQQFPADFISEAIDQTRGWFYSQLAISTLLFSPDDEIWRQYRHAIRQPLPHDYPHPYRNCIVLGLMLGEDGNKMSKSKRNYREPQEIFDRYGADALRWYFFANQPPWTSIRYNEQAIKDSIPEFLLRLWNVYSFFVIYASIDKFDPAAELSGKVGELDRPRTCRRQKAIDRSPSAASSIAGF